MRKGIFEVIFVLILSLVLTGCLIRTYTVTKERSDQDITGNRGYIQGKAPSLETKKKSSTRETVVIEVELRSPIKFGKGRPKIQKVKGIESERGHQEKQEQLIEQEISPLSEAEGKSTFTQYKVQSGDTLQKISKKFYGSYNKWQKIYNANKDKIKNPDDISPGLILEVPEE